MKKLGFAFYRSTKGFFGPAIRFKQYRMKNLPYRHAQFSHVELVFDGECFSSSEVDGGVRFKHIDLDTLIKPKDPRAAYQRKWEIIEIEVTNEEYFKCLAWAKSQTGNRYSKLGIFFAQILNFNFKKKGDWFCSEICLATIQGVGMFCRKNALFTTPGDLHKMLERRMRKK